MTIVCGENLFFTFNNGVNKLLTLRQRALGWLLKGGGDRLSAKSEERKTVDNYFRAI